MLKRLVRSEATQRALGCVIGLYLSAALRSSRWRIEADPATWSLLTGQGGHTALVVFWHEHLAVVPILWWEVRRENPALSLNALISRNRDGRMIAAVMRRWDVASVHGSSTRIGKSNKGGSMALRSLASLLRNKQLVCLTPDGPRGPRRVMQPGAAHLAAVSGVPVVPVAAICWPALRAGSWDRMLLPLPFGRCIIRCGKPIAVDRRNWEASSAPIADALNALDRPA